MDFKREKTEYLSPEKIEEQENLTLNRLQNLNSALGNEIDETRPTQNFIDVMNWTVSKFGNHLKDNKNLNKYIHNKITIDGQFVHFCESKNVKIDILYKDSIVSWETETGFEKFFAQGVFLIRTKNLEFIHAALFHKGNQNEDEISFFTIVSNSNYINYIKFRNEFDDWILQRDRSNLHIRVVDGQDIPYTRDCSWEEMFLPNDLKLEVKNLVESFLNGQQFYLDNKIPWKRGLLLYGEPGNGKTSIIRTIISMYNFKPITIIPNATNETIQEAFAYAEEQSPSLLYFEDLDSLFEKGVDISSFLNLMDGITAKNGLLVIATANDVNKLKSNITDRPSRFDRKFEIPLPDLKMSQAYLKKWFGTLISAKKLKELATYATKYKFSYAYLKELYITSMFEALSNNRKVPTEKDISKSLDKIMKDKNILKSGKSINIDKYI